LSDDFIEENLVADDIQNSWPPHTQSNASEQEMEEADYVLSQEENELQALIALMEEREQQDSASQHYGSDDEDYDQIFMECTADAEWPPSDPATNRNDNDTDAMDMTDG
jgi:protein-tyrosine-phosphatase